MPVRTCIGGHDNDGIFKVYHPPMGICDLSVIQNLQQNIEHIRMRFFQLIKQHDGIGLSADSFRQLSRLVIAHITRR